MSKIQTYVQAERIIHEYEQDPEVRRYKALRSQLKAMEQGKDLVDPVRAINIFLDTLKNGDRVSVYDIRSEVSEAALIPANRGLAGLIRARVDFSETNDRFMNNAVFVKRIRQ